MENTLYLSQLAEARTHTLSKPQFEEVYGRLQRLQENPLADTHVLSESGNLRIAEVKNYRVIFRFVPADHAVLVTDIEPAAQMHAVAA